MSGAAGGRSAAWPAALASAACIACGSPADRPGAPIPGVAGRPWGASACEASQQVGSVERGTEWLRHGEIDRSIRTLTELEAAPDHAGALDNALAMAYLARFQRDERAADLLAALASADRAVRARPCSPAATYNLALALTELSLVRSAARAWKAHLELDPSGPWAKRAAGYLWRMEDAIEPERRFAVLAERLVEGRPATDETAVAEALARHPLEVRKLAERELLRRWGEATLAGSPAQAERHLAVATAVARGLSRERGDHLLREAVERIAASEPSAAGRRAELAAAHVDYAGGMQAYEERELQVASKALRNAADAFRRAGSRFALLADLHLGVLAYLADLRSGGERLEALAASVDAARFPSLAADVEWMLGLVEMGRGAIPEALAHYQAARALHERASGPAAVGAVEQLLAEAYEERGQVSAAWEHRLRALRALPYLDGPRRRHATLNDAAIALAVHGPAEVADRFLEEVLANARAWGQPEPLAEAHRLRARLLVRQGRFAEARAESETAIEALRRGPRAPQIERLEASLWLTRGMALATSDPATALAELERAWQAQRSRGFLSERLEYLLARARAGRARGDLAMAEEALVTAVEEFERLRRETPGLLDRAEVFHWAQQAFDELLELRLERGDPPFDTLEIAERARGRILLDRWLPRSARHDLSRQLLVEAVRDLGADCLLAVYHVLPERTVVWSIHAGRVEQRILPLATRELRAAVGGLLSALAPAREAAGSAEADRLRSVLYEALVMPLGLPEGVRRLILVPDRFLTRLPFTVLAHPGSGDLLIESVAVSLAPSAALAGLIRRSADELAKREPAVLVVSDPHLDDRDRFRFPELPGARAEALEIAGLYPEASHLSGEQATTEALLESPPRFTVLHYAGHAASDLDLEGGTLLLAAESGRGGRLTLRSLLERPPRQWELVVLAACEGASLVETAREGMYGLASGFLSAGASAVLAARTEIDDDRTRPLMLAFHRRYLRHRDAARALREAWQETRAPRLDPEELRRLATFVVLGG